MARRCEPTLFSLAGKKVRVEKLQGRTFSEVHTGLSSFQMRVEGLKFGKRVLRTIISLPISLEGIPRTK
jgi:hypothetical protein